MDRIDFMNIVYDLLKDDPDNNRANEIIDVADAYADEYAENMVKDTMEKCFFVLKIDLESFRFLILKIDLESFSLFHFKN